MNKETQKSGTNPALKDLEVFVGEWSMQLSNASFLPDLSAKVSGQVSIEWKAKGAVIAMGMGREATWVIGRDESSEIYKVFYYDSREISRVYEMSFNKGVWKMWRNSPKFSQRFEGKLSKDKKIITAHWEKCLDGKTWEHDFDVRYTKKI